MTKQELYKLNFEKLNIKDWGIRYGCTSYSNNVTGSSQLASLLDTLSDREPDYLLEEINLALSGGDYEEYYSPDMSGVESVRISPPNAIINDDFSISLIDLKELLEEWIEFVEN